VVSALPRWKMAVWDDSGRGFRRRPIQHVRQVFIHMVMEG
jgi:hypothetical protein